MNISNWKLNRLYVPRYQSRDTKFKEISTGLINLEYSTQLFDNAFLVDFRNMLELLTPFALRNGKLIRVGRESDGGYLIFDGVTTSSNKRIASIGIGNEYSFENQMMGMGYQILAVDGSVNNPFHEQDSVTYEKIFVGPVTSMEQNTIRYCDLLSKKDWNLEVELVKIDIEGWEYSVLESDISGINQANQIVVEFHGLELLGDIVFRNKFISLLESIRKTHKVIHVHGNNSGRCIRFPNADFPTILEVTFIKSRFCANSYSEEQLPLAIDFRNTPIRPEINMSPFFRNFEQVFGNLQTIAKWI